MGVGSLIPHYHKFIFLLLLKQQTHPSTHLSQTVIDIHLYRQYSQEESELAIVII